VSDFEAIASVSRTLRVLLESHITNDPSFPIASVPIDLRSPKELREDSVDLCVSVWLYRVNRNPDLANEPPPPGPSIVNRYSIPLDLHFLITPIADDPESDQKLLGSLVQVLHDHAAIGGAALQGSLRGGPDELRVSMELLSLEDLSRVWNALDEPYQLSVPYLVQLVRIDSGHDPMQREPVLSRTARYAQVLGAR
jgi:hypothetical protein